jgi:sugar phosphate permease
MSYSLTALYATLFQVIRNPGTWLLALTYFFVYIVRQGSTSWLMMYLMQVWSDA